MKNTSWRFATAENPTTGGTWLFIAREVAVTGQNNTQGEHPVYKYCTVLAFQAESSPKDGQGNEDQTCPWC